MHPLTRWQKLKLYVAYVWKQLTWKDWSAILGSLVAILLLIVLVIRPAIIGYNAYQDIKSANHTVSSYGQLVTQLETGLSQTENVLVECETARELTSQSLDEATNHVDACKTEAASVQDGLRAQIATLERESAAQDAATETAQTARLALEKERDTLAAQAASAQATYDTLAQNAANNICCKAKVDDAAIDSYLVSNDRISCAKGSTLKISC